VRLRLKKRIRKKLHKGEFQELGFTVLVRFKEGLTGEARETFLDEFILQTIEASGLLFGGGADELKLTGFVTPADRGSATDEHRDRVAAWLKNRLEVHEVEIGNLVDAWYE
jgi:uncharacterized protein